MGRILLILVLAVLFLGLAGVSIYLAYQLAAIYFSSHTYGLVAAAALFLFGGFFVFKDMTKG